MTGRRVWRVVAVGLILALGLGGSSCGGSSKTSTQRGPWAQNPRGAREVSAADLDAMSADGTLVPITPDKWQTDADRRAAEAAADQAVIDQLVAAHPELQDRLEPPVGPQVTVLPDGNHEVGLTLPDGTTHPILLHGKRVRQHTIVQAWQRFNTLENQTAIYQAFYPLMADDCVAGRPAPDALAGLGIDDLKTHNKEMARCLLAAGQDQGDPNPDVPAGRVTDRGQYQGAAPPASDGVASDSGGGVGIDSSKCDHYAGGIYHQAVWAGKWYDTAVKWQGRRGSCVSFAIVGAMEQAIARMAGDWVDLDEQHLYATAKVKWSPDDFEDGLSLPGTIGDMMDDSYALRFEDAWPYNPSPKRLPCNGDPSEYDCSKDYEDPDYYIDSCLDYDATCSETTHQAEAVCHDGDCYYHVPGLAAAKAYRIAGAVELDDIEDPQSALLAVAAINLGFGVVAAFSDYQSFHDVGANGVYQGRIDGDDHLGGHAVHLSGIVYNSKVPAGIPKGSGGGYVVIKNSWGCSADGGYYYMAFDAADDLMDSVMGLLPSQPLQDVAPKIEITSPAGSTSINVSQIMPDSHFAATVSDYEDGAGCCGVTWYLDTTYIGSGVTLDAPYPTDASTCTDNHSLAAYARDSQGKVTSAYVNVQLVVDAPQVTISAPTSGQTLYRGVTYVFQASATSLKDGNLPCDAVVWGSNTAGDAVIAQTGCAVPTSFTTNGARQIFANVYDSCGKSSSTYVSVTVVDPVPTNPPVVAITAPIGTSGSPYYDANPSAALSLTATATSPGGHPLSYSWGARDAGTASAFTPLATSQSYSWPNPSAQFGFTCGGREIEIQFCASDSNGTTCTSTFVNLAYPTC